MIDAGSEHIDDAPFADFIRQSGQEFEAVVVLGVADVTQGEFGKLRRLGGLQEGKQVVDIDGMGAVVVLRAPGRIAGAAVGRRVLGHPLRWHR